jgi:hypothetical protein
MKRLLFALLLTICCTSSIFAQKKLSSSRISSEYTFIYKLTDQEAFDLAADPEKPIQQKFLHSLVDSFKNELNKQYGKRLPYGNYLYVDVMENQFNYQLRAVQNVKISPINDGNDFRFIVTDLNGNLISNADVLQGKNRKLRFDPVSRSYIGALNEKLKLLSVVYEGVYNCFTYYYQKPVRNRKDDRYSKRDEENLTDKYVGQLIFNKPKYKPLDTVKFKAYLLTSEGKALKNLPLRVEMNRYGEKGIFIANIEPYRPGAYEGSFVLADSMKLKLDNSYSVDLQTWTKTKWTTIKSGTINYEEYELNSTSFTVRSDKTIQYPGKPVTFFLKAIDENGLAVPDGQVSVAVNSSWVHKRFEGANFVKSILWTNNLNLDPVGETKLILPDSIFPKANMNLTVDFTFRNSNNEVRKVQRYVSYNYENVQLISTLGADSVYLNLLRNGDPLQHTHAKLYTIGRNFERRDSADVDFPVRLKIDPDVSNYVVKMADGQKYDSNYPQLGPDFKLTADHSRDSLKVHVSNAQHVPFWYTLFAGNKAVKRGYANRIDTAMAFSEDKIAEISVDYLWHGRMQHLQRRGLYEKQELRVQLDAPAAIYPGQTVQMGVNVTDISSKPVANTDVTAYAYTAKFPDEDDLYPLMIGDPYRFREHKNLPSNLIPLEKLGGVPLEWNRWHRRFGLDSIVYYQFAYPNELYIGQESTKSEDAVVVPFAIKDGQIDPAYIVYIDGQPVYYINADQFRHYAFKVSPGLHKIEILTFTRHITFEYEFKKGFKTILGITSDVENTKAQVRKVGMLEFTRLQEELQKHLLFVNDNFEGNKTIISGGPENLLLNPPPKTFLRKMLRIGPLIEKNLVFKSGELKMPFVWQPGMVYTFLTSGVKTEALDSASNWIPYNDTSPEARLYNQNPILRNEIDSIWNDYMDLSSRTRRNINTAKLTGNNTGQLQMELDTSVNRMQQYLKNVIIYKKDDPTFKQVYGAGDLSFQPMDEGIYRFLLLFKDNSYFVLDNYFLKGGGTNYLLLKRQKLNPPDEMSKALDRDIKNERMAKPGTNTYDYKIPARQVFYNLFEKIQLVNRMSGVVVDAATMETLPNATIYYQSTAKDELRPIRSTKVNGSFDLQLPKSGILTFAFTGYDSKKVKIKNAVNLRIMMSEAYDLRDVVIRGYVGSGKRKVQDVPVANVEQLLQGKVAGLNIQNNTGAPGLRGSVNIRGLSTVTTTGAPGSSSDPSTKALFIVDGRPYTGDLSSIDQTAIISIEILDDRRAQALYGDLGKNGVILIKTNGTQHFGAGDENAPQQQTMRTNFSDAAFWQPKLLTDKNGSATFRVKFPDDITSWNTRVYAVNDRKQSGYFKTFIRSFKSLSANFVAPQFALNGDQISVIGKLMNYNDREERMVRSFVYNDQEVLNGRLAFKNAHIDTMSILAPSTGDSLKFQYTLRQDSGYFDGELRKIPLLPVGTIETKGYFNALNSDTTVTYNFDPALGKVTLHAESSVFPVLLDEMDKLRRYEYLCNEQVASKLKALLLEQKLRKFLGEDFKGEKAIKELIRRLQDSKTAFGTWGWWQDSDTEVWISGHVVEALVMARQAGFEVELNTTGLISYLNGQLNAGKSLDQLQAIRLMRTLDAKYDLGDWIKSADQQLKTEKEPSLYQNLSLMRLKQQAGKPVDIQWLLKQKKSTLFGNIYWGEPGTNFWDNSIQNTLLAYQILKEKGGYKNELDHIIQYFLEQRKDGQWRNTYESALILETILPDLMADGKKPATPSLIVNKTETVSNFPFSKTTDPSKLTIDKKGDSPVYLTAYQQFQNPNPEKISKDFTVRSTFLQNDKEVKSLKGGTTAYLKAEVEVRADADYVMIEIPIPAGCSYENKPQSYWGSETHREYFKHKTSIFCTKLKQGKYTFTVQLMPRYSGVYNLNPAKAEMMYFPVFSGQEGMKKITVR